MHRFYTLILKKPNLLLLLFSVAFGVNKTQAQCPPNVDFETGTFNNWQCSVGTVGVLGGVNVINLNPSLPFINRHEITSGPGLDEYGHFPVVCPFGGTYSVRLGNDSIGRGAEGVSYRFFVPPTQDTFTLTYFYAVVFQNPEHAAEEQPRFFVRAYDVATGENISCASYDYVATSGIPGFEVSDVNGTVLFKRWAPVSIQFAGLGGHTIALEFKTADCTRGGHFGYAYVDVSAGCSGILAQAPYCAESNSLILNAPFGFQNYTWYNSNYTAVVGTGQSVTLSPPPVTSGIFHVDMEPFPGFGCRDTADAVVVRMPVPDTPVAVSYYQYCHGALSTQLTATAWPDHGLIWYTSAAGGIGTDIAPTPSTFTDGIYEYYVSQKTLLGCESLRKKITVAIVPPPSITFRILENTGQCLTGNQFTFVSSPAGFTNPVYQWVFDDGNGAVVRADTVTHSYSNPGTYHVTLRISDELGCVSQETLPVTVHPIPVADFDEPAVICQHQTAVALADQSYFATGTGTLTDWWWSLNGTTSTAQNPLPFTVTDDQFTVRLAVRSSEGCISDTISRNLLLRRRPVAAFATTGKACENEVVRFNDLSDLPLASGNEIIDQWNWQFGSGATSSFANPQHIFPTGPQRVQLTVTSNYGCISLPVDSSFIVHEKPVTGLQLSDSCINTVVRFTALDPGNTVTTWRWNWGSGFSIAGSQVPRTFPRAVNGTVLLSGETSFGCRDTVQRSFVIYENPAFAGRDTSGPLGEPVQLNAHGGSNVQYLWSPPDGLSSTTIENPVATLNHDQLYNLYSISDKGCVRRSRINILRYKGPEIYIPTAFSPNGDGVNDEFKAVAYGVTQFGFLAVYDRYGNELFNTRDVRRGWNGTYKGAEVPSGTYVFMARGVDFKGREIFKKGTVILIR